MADKAKWTTEQQEAIKQKGCNLLVAAAAGAGKTSVLVERIIRKITAGIDPVDIDRLLVMTFTDAAATEMRERIVLALSEVLEKNPDSAQLQKQLVLLNKASIMTIHSFCLKVVRDNFVKLDLDPNFRISDATEADLMKHESVDELFEERYDSTPVSEDFLSLLDCYGGNRSDRELQELVLEIYEFSQSEPWPDKWLDGMTESYNMKPGDDLFNTGWGSTLLNSIELELTGHKIKIMGSIEEVQTADGMERYAPVIEADLAIVNNLLDIISKKNETEDKSKWGMLYAAFKETEFGRLPNAGKNADAEAKKMVQDTRDELKSYIKGLKTSVLCRNEEDTISDFAKVYPLLKYLTGLVKDFGEKYRKLKDKRSILDFNDLEHFCLEILTNFDDQGNAAASEIAIEYRKKYEEVLIDEYQDSNMVQETILRRVSREEEGTPNVFMVGDVKQSIYRFRNARPEIFMKKYNEYPMEEGGLSRKIKLYKNFRSRREVIDPVNYIFERIMSLNIGELNYTEDEALCAGASYPDLDSEDIVAGGDTEFHLIETSPDRINGEMAAPAATAEFVASAEQEDDKNFEAQEEDNPDRIQTEARLAADIISKLMKPDEQGRNFCVFDREIKKYRRVEYKDIVILMRSTKGRMEVFLQELIAKNIPAFADTGTGFFMTVEVKVILSLLQIIDNPIQDIPLLAVLRSPIVGFTSDELAFIRLAHSKATIYEALVKLSEDKIGADVPEPELDEYRKTSEKAAAFIENLKSWREKSKYLSTDQLLWALYNETGYYGMVAALPAGEQRRANLRILFERARQFEETSYKGLFNFINFIEKLKSGGGDMGSAKTLGENENVVRIMSIHKSKGLEFPVVLLAGCGKRFNYDDVKKGILLHHELGFGADIVDRKLRLAYPSLAKSAIAEKAKIETLSEEMRILYVAMTRAKEKLIMIGAMNNVENKLDKWTRISQLSKKKVPAFAVKNGTCYYDWIIPALMLESKWEIKRWRREDILAFSPAEEENDKITLLLDDAEKSEDDDIYREIDTRLSWNYPFIKSTEIPVKISVTELKRRFNVQAEDEFAPSTKKPIVKPSFLEEERGLTAAERGSAAHFVVQHLDFNNTDIESQISEMVSKQLLTKQQAAGVDSNKIKGFFESTLGRRVMASEAVYREVPFNIEIPCTELRFVLEKDMHKGETMLLQGVIDCFFEEQGELVLLDYKTDYVEPGKTDTIKERYATQIKYYAQALERLTGKRVKQRYIFLLKTGEAMEL
ncbi:MAG: helicase-exonuclease AddAB subunit AddA [Eubacteriales bacterium]|nr:helicase-exonuclease AddAB subunit AddA [Eubacteriales bacterium]